VKIALICERFDPNGGGLEQWAWQFVQGMMGRGHEVEVVTFRAAACGDADLIPSLHVLPWHRDRLKRARAVEAALPAIVADVVHDLGVGWACDILHPQSGSKLGNHLREIASQTYGKRCLHAISPQFWRWRLEMRGLERRQYWSGATFIAVSNMVARDMRELHGAPSDSIRLVPNGVNWARFSPQRCGELRASARGGLNLTNETLFLFAAHNPRLKGLRPLLKAMRELLLTHPRARLVVIGREAEQAFLREAVRSEVERSVIFAGFVEDPLPYFAAADVFVLPTYYDACSLSVLEAAGCGLSVITSRYNGASELMTNGREGFILEDPDDHHELAAAMARLTDPALRGRMSSAARALALRCGMEANVAKIEEVYREVMARRCHIRKACQS
jgi:UDP-glucose:(heptosyl)LPS alpha-1,3-glucosyltransferase